MYALHLGPRNQSQVSMGRAPFQSSGKESRDFLSIYGSVIRGVHWLMAASLQSCLHLTRPLPGLCLCVYLLFLEGPQPLGLGPT